MPYDTTSYFKIDLPDVQEYGRNNPPKRMSEAIRMGVADVRAQEAAGIEYNWSDCAVCTASAVMRRCGATEPNRWWQWGGKWHDIMSALSQASLGQLAGAFNVWPRGFASPPAKESVPVTHPNKNLAQWSRDMLALADRLEAEGS